jgi:hypothetical protein
MLSERPEYYYRLPVHKWQMLQVPPILFVCLFVRVINDINNSV